jgi:dUTP pyrophosphatase
MGDYSGRTVLTVKRLDPRATLPLRGSPGAVGHDLAAMMPKGDQRIIVRPWQRARISTGLAFAIPKGFYGRVAPRSGLAYKNGIDILGGVIDPDYTGEVFVIVLNTSAAPFEVTQDMRIAQLILEAVIAPPVIEVDSLEETERGTAGFGSTGLVSDNYGATDLRG